MTDASDLLTAERRDDRCIPNYPEINSLCSEYGVYAEYSV
jgi:hypothetical protein